MWRLRTAPLFLLAAIACQPESEGRVGGEAPAGTEMFAAIPDEPPVLANNEITPAKVELGRMLYFDPRLSRSWLISCNTCHNVGLAGVDLVETSIGHGWQKGPRNAPTVLNAVFNVAQFWDGRAADLMEQAQGPVQAGVEMNNTPDRVVETLKSIPAYVQRFEDVFPGEADPVTFENMARAIEAFEATLITPGSKFDHYLGGDAEALNPLEKEGLEAFTARGCTACHNGVNVGGQGYFEFGLAEQPGDDVLPRADRGRFAVTQSASDDYVFRAPALRNVELTAPFFHSGFIWDLREAVDVMGTAQLGADLTEAEMTAIVAFLRSLTGEQPVVEYPILPPHTADTPLPDVGVGGVMEH